MIRKINPDKKDFVIFLILAVVGFVMTIVIENSKTNPAILNKKVWLGVETIEITPLIQDQYGLHSSRGLLVSRVFVGSPSALAGVQPGDVIRRWDGVSVTNQDQLQNLIWGSTFGAPVLLSINRDGASTRRKIVVAERPGQL